MLQLPMRLCFNLADANVRSGGSGCRSPTPARCRGREPFRTAPPSHPLCRHHHSRRAATPRSAPPPSRPPGCSRLTPSSRPTSTRPHSRCPLQEALPRSAERPLRQHRPCSEGLPSDGPQCPGLHRLASSSAAVRTLALARGKRHRYWLRSGPRRRAPCPPKLTCNRIDIRAGRYADLVAQAPRQHRLMQHRCRGDRWPTSGLQLALNAPEAVKQCDRVLIGVRHAHQITSADASAGATGRTACGSSDAASPLAWDTRGRIRGGKQNLSPRSGRGYNGGCPREIVVAIGEPPARHRVRLGNLQKAGRSRCGKAVRDRFPPRARTISSAMCPQYPRWGGTARPSPAKSRMAGRVRRSGGSTPSTSLPHPLFRRRVDAPASSASRAACGKPRHDSRVQTSRTEQSRSAMARSGSTTPPRATASSLRPEGNGLLDHPDEACRRLNLDRRQGRRGRDIDLFPRPRLSGGVAHTPDLQDARKREGADSAFPDLVPNDETRIFEHRRDVIAREPRRIGNRSHHPALGHRSHAARIPPPARRLCWCGEYAP